jgi:hypothetical protein
VAVADQHHRAPAALGQAEAAVGRESLLVHRAELFGVSTVVPYDASEHASLLFRVAG